MKEYYRIIRRDCSKNEECFIKYQSPGLPVYDTPSMLEDCSKYSSLVGVKLLTSYLNCNASMNGRFYFYPYLSYSN